MKAAFTLLFLIMSQNPATNFIRVEGPDLKSRLSAAIKLGSAQRQDFWVAYSFDVKPGVAFDVDFIGSRGEAIVFNGATAGSPLETPNLGVFLLHESGGRTIVRAEIYNLDRPRDYAGHPVYWLGRGAGEESLPLLRGLLDTVQSYRPAERLVDAIGAHDHPRVPESLRDLIRRTKTERVRATAVSWLGHWPGQTEFLAALVRDEREPAPVRREAAEALGESTDREAMPVLQQLYRAVSHREVKRELLDAISDDRFESAAVAFLIQTAEREPDRELRREALESLGEKTDILSFQALERAAHNADTGLDMQRTAVEAISERPEDEALPLLKKIASSHPRREVRNEALEQLGQRPGQLPFLVELASNGNESLDLRRNAIEAIAEIGSGDAIAALKNLFASANHRDLKEEIIEAFEDTADRTGSIDFLAGIARQESDREIRADALSVLGDMDDDRAIDALVQSYDAARDEETKNEILDALSDSGSARALQKLVAVAQRDPSVRLRKRAVALLGESDNPAAFEVLEQLLK